MTADDDLSQKMQIAQQRIVETAPSEAPAGERDSVLEPAQKKVRFAARVEKQAPDGHCYHHSTEYQLEQQFEQHFQFQFE